jgi:hypothetical protein
MPITFDVFTRKTKFYYIMEAIAIVTGCSLAACGIFNVQFNTRAPFINGLIDGVIILATFMSLFFVIAMATGLVRTYIKTGELILADDYIIIDDTKVLLTEAKDIRLKLGQWSKRHLGNISRNHIEITGKNGKIYKNRFVIKSYNHNLDFEKVLFQWQTNGVVFDWEYYAFP